MNGTTKNKFLTNDFYLPTLLLTLATLLSACGGGDSANSAPSTDADIAEVVSPKAIAINASYLIKPDASISIQFDKSVDTSSYLIEGNLAEESDGGVWSQTSIIDDTLTITPKTSWTVNTNRTLIINVKDLVGNAMSELTLTHDVYNGTLYYVNNAATDDSGDGLSLATAKATILSAINTATAPATVVVNAGTYAVSDAPESRIELAGGISLYGGYSADFTARTPQSSTVTSATHVVHGIGTGITNAVLVDGFTFQTTTTYFAIDLEAAASPTIQNNTIQSLYAGIRNTSASPVIKGNTFNLDGNQCNGIQNFYSSPTIINNTLQVIGACTNNITYIDNLHHSHPLIQNNHFKAQTNFTSNYYGIYSADFSSPNIIGNIINGPAVAGGAGFTAAIYNSGANPYIYGNTIIANNGGGPGIHSLGGNPIIIQNDIISSAAGSFAYSILGVANAEIISNTFITTGTCISEIDATDDPQLLQLNNFKSCGVLYRNEDSTDITSITAVNALADIAIVNGNYISP